MKRIVFLLLALIPLLVFGQKAKIEFETTSHNFGTISETGGKATVDFIFKNTGSAPLILTNVRAGCGCTTPEWAREPIAPGASGKIKVSYDPRNRPGAFVKSVTVNSNAENAVTSLTIRGTVTRKPTRPYENYKFSIGPIKAVTNAMNLGAIKNTQHIEKNVEIVNAGDEPATVEVKTTTPHITATVTPSTLEKGQRGTIHIVYEALNKNDWGFVSDPINITVNGTHSNVFYITATISEDFFGVKAEEAPVAVFSEKEIDLGEIEKGSTKTHEFYIQNTGKSDLVIRKIKPSDDYISVTLPKTVIKPGKKMKAIITLKAGDVLGRRIRIAQFTLNDPQNSIVVYKVTARVQ